MRFVFPANVFSGQVSPGAMRTSLRLLGIMQKSWAKLHSGCVLLVEDIAVFRTGPRFELRVLTDYGHTVPTVNHEFVREMHYALRVGLAEFLGCLVREHGLPEYVSLQHIVECAQHSTDESTIFAKFGWCRTVFNEPELDAFLQGLPADVVTEITAPEPPQADHGLDLAEALAAQLTAEEHIFLIAALDTMMSRMAKERSRLLISSSRMRWQPTTHLREVGIRDQQTAQALRLLIEQSTPMYEKIRGLISLGVGFPQRDIIKEIEESV